MKPLTADNQSPPLTQIMKLLTFPLRLAEETIVAPSEIAAEETTDEIGEGYRVILYNDEFHSYDEVVLQIQKATGCRLEIAIDVMLEAHHKGRAVCHRGAREECQRVCRVLREIRLQCEVDCD